MDNDQQQTETVTDGFDYAEEDIRAGLLPYLKGHCTHTLSDLSGQDSQWD